MPAKSFLREIGGAVSRVFGVQVSAGSANSGDIPALSDNGALDLSLIPATMRRVRIDHEFATNAAGVWTFAATAGGASSPANGPIIMGRLGVYNMRSSTTANSGVRVLTGASTFSIAGGETANFVWFLSSVAYATSQVVLGYTNSISNAPGNHEVCFVVSAGVVIGRCARNNSSSSTSALLTITADVFYRFEIFISDDGTQVTFSVYTDAGSLLASASLTTNIPNDGVYRVAHGIIATSSGTTQQDVASFDHMSHEARQTNRFY